MMTFVSQKLSHCFLTKKPLMFFTISTAMLMFSANANATCYSKQPTGFSELVIVAEDGDKNTFLDAGFTARACPNSFEPTEQKAEDFCTQMDGWSKKAQAIFTENFGVTTKQICKAAKTHGKKVKPKKPKKIK